MLHITRIPLKPTTLIAIFGFILLSFTYSFAEKVYVVERERGNLSVIRDGRHSGEIGNLGNMNHAIVKFHGGLTYVISRDGYLSSIDIATDRLLKKVKVGESSIGFVFCDGYIAVANYDPKDVVILNSDLSILKRIETGSRNVGIKAKDRFLIFALMDKDEVWVLDSAGGFNIHKIFKNIGSMPFDALLTDNIYIVGFFKEGSVGIVDLKTMRYSKKELRKGDGEITFKIPHFGTWGIYGNKAFIPAIGERKIYVLELKDFTYHSQINITGLPVFVASSPEGGYLAVNYSGDKEDFITIIDPATSSRPKDIKAGRRIMHIRPSGDGRGLYLSSYFEGKVKFIGKNNWDVMYEIDVPTPSGIFLIPANGR